MGVLDNIKRKISDFSFSRKESPAREVKAINIKHAKTVGIVYRGDNEEAKEFECVKFFESSIKLRKFDEVAKKEGLKIKSINEYKNLLISKLI